MKTALETTRSLIAVTLWAFILLLLFTTVRTFAADLGPTAPYPADSGPNGGEHVFLIRKNQQRGVNRKIDLIAYYPTTVSGWNSKYISIEHNAGWNCEYDDSGMSNTDKNHFIRVELQAGSNTPVDYFIQSNNVCNQHYGRPNVAGVDPTNTLFGNYMLPAQPAAPNGVSGLYQVQVTISYYPASVPTSDLTTGKNNSILMQVIGRDGDGTKSLTMKLGPNGVGIGSYNFPLAGKPSTAGTSTSVSVPFGLPCDERAPVIHTIGVYDADNGGAFWETLRFKIRDLDWSEPVPSAPGYNPSSGDDINFSSGVGGSPNSDNFNNTPFTPDNGNKGQATVDVKMMPYHRYEIDIYGLDGGNTVVVSLPTDTIFGAIKCQLPPAPTVSCVVNAASPTPAGNDERIGVNGSQTNYNPTYPKPSVLRLKITSITDSNGNLYPTPPYYDAIPPYNYGFLVSGLPPGSYSVAAKVSDPNPPAPYTNISDTCTGGFNIIAEPYLSIYGGDAEAGVSPQYDDASSAYSKYTDSSASFVGWNGNNGSPWGAAGAQWAVQALGTINGFASGRGATSGYATVPWYLSLANTSLSGDEYGGQFGGTSNITVNYSDYTNNANAFYPNGNGSGPYELGSQTVGTQTIVVKGNIYISGPLVYSSTGWVNLSDIPSYKLISLGGNIYIQYDVGQLDGTYMAIPTPSGTGGNIYTCSDRLPFTTIYNPVDTASPAYYSKCNHQLKVNGALVAKKVYFGRTYGSYMNQTGDNWGNSGAAEEIIFGPEMWLSGAGGESGNYSAVTGLPPIL